MSQTHYERMNFRAVASYPPHNYELIQKLVERGEADMFPFGIWHTMQENNWPTEAISAGFTGALRLVMRALMDKLDDPYSYSLLTRDPQYGRLYAQMMTMGGRAIVEPSMMADYYGLTYERAGKRTYDVHPDLAERLVHTELRGLNADDLRLPYEAIYLMVPPAAGLKVWNDESEWHTVEGIYLVEDRHMHEGDDVGRPFGPATRGWRIMVVGAPKGKMRYAGIELDDDALSYFRVRLPEGKSLDECIAACVAETEASLKSGRTLWSRQMNDELIAHFRWAMNVVLYCTWEEPGERWEQNREARQLWERIQKIPKGRKRDNLLEKAKGVQRQPRLRLGYKIRVQRHGPAPMESEKSGAFHEGPGVRTRVSGHWRRQAHGPGRTERKIIWIEPHWRNLDGEVPAEEPTHAVR